VAIEGMRIVIGKKKNKKAMLSDTESMDEGGEGDKGDGEAEGERELDDSEETDHSKEEEPSGGEGGREEREEMEYYVDWKKIIKTMNANMASATEQLNSNSEDEEDEDSSKEGENFKEWDEGIYTRDDDLSEGKYDSDVEEVSSGIFDAEHSKKYEMPQNFMQALWNAAGPAVGSMLTQLDLIKLELEGDEVDVEPDYSKIDPQLIDFFVEEAGENPKEVIKYINTVSMQLVQYGEDTETEEEATPPNKEHLTHDKGEGTTPASKTQGTLPRAPEASLAEETAKETATRMAGGDEEGAQSMSMAPGG
jgi:hypothetical protein